MTIISPSLLSCDFLNLEREILTFSQEQDVWLHLDIMDGHFVPQMTFGHPILKKVANLVSSKRGEGFLPKLDAHLMVTNPLLYLQTLKDYHLHNFTFHWEAEVHHDRLITEIKKHYPSCGISLNPSTPLEVVPDYIFQKVDLVLLMTVNPGFGGQSFIWEVLSKVRQLREKREKLDTKFSIQVDGGVNDQTAKELHLAGADNLVAGSYIFQGEPENYLKQIEKLRKAL